MPRFWKIRAHCAYVFLWLKGWRDEELRRGSLAIAVYVTSPWWKLRDGEINSCIWEMEGPI